MGNAGPDKQPSTREVEERSLVLIHRALDNVREAAYLIDEGSRFHFVNAEE